MPAQNSSTPPPPPNFETRTLFRGDNLKFLRGLNTATVDLIATDPPFNKGKDFHATPDTLSAGASFQDRWSWKDDIHEAWIDQIKDDRPAVWQTIMAARLTYGDDLGAYLCYMAVRLIEMHRVLKDTGSIYLHCDPTASHYLKAMMDAIFGKKNFLNEIVWCYSNSGRAKKTFAKKHDVILFYGKTKNYIWTEYRVPVEQKHVDAMYKHVDSKGRRCRKVTVKGRDYVYYQDEGKICNDWWPINPLNHNDKERTGYPTQKPIDLYKRIIEASSNVGDIVLDPFCGCATTLIAAEQLGREWIGMDIWGKAHDVVIERLKAEWLTGPDGDRQDRLPFDTNQITYRTDIPSRTDIAEDDTTTPAFYLRQGRVLAPWERLTHKQMTEILAEAQQNGEGITCAGCGRSLEIQFLELDHINPKKDGGPNHIENRILLCGPCNRKKKANLTLSGLHRENKKDNWMHNLEKAKASHQRAIARAQRAKAES